MQLARRLSTLGMVGAAVAAALYTAPAAAQTASTDAENIDEVLVTARRRSETFKDVPITVNVFTREAIEAAAF
jgi:iron complex outermembrane receptor protein